MNENKENKENIKALYIKMTQLVTSFCTIPNSLTAININVEQLKAARIAIKSYDASATFENVYYNNIIDKIIETEFRSKCF